MDATATFRLRQVLAFTAVYVIWGSTYLAIRFAIETLPLFTMGGVRFVVSGAMLYLGARLLGAPKPELRNWWPATVMGGLLLVGGNGSVMWAEQKLSSGLAALLVGTEPLWVVVLFWAWPGGRGPLPRTVVGLVIGFAGAALLAMGAENIGGVTPHVPSVIVVLLGCISWATGSLYGRTAELPKSPFLTTGMQMLGGGALLLLTGAVAGEWRNFEPQAFSTTSLLAFAYLIVFGSVAFCAYVWLVRTTEPTLVATYAYVNPAVAVFLGWLLAGEPIGGTTPLAMVLIIAAVVLVSTASSRRLRPKPKTPEKVAPEGDPVLEQCA